MRSKTLTQLFLLLSLMAFGVPAVSVACPNCPEHKAAQGGAADTAKDPAKCAAHAAAEAAGAAEMNCPEGCCTEKCKGDCPGMQGGKCPHAEAAPAEQPKQ